MSGTLGANQKDTLVIKGVKLREGQPEPLGGFEITARLRVRGRLFDLDVTRGEVGQFFVHVPLEASQNVVLATGNVSFIADGAVHSTLNFRVNFQDRT